ncbi:chemotaxis protein CheD [Roseateles sp. DXS20W]|uniref:Chemotaxis protein CheD n=1 Tax=Pelomonas lactea TaxID=3299030 RepID=A0ABW7GPM3_9BURK
MTPAHVTLHPGDVACVDRGGRLETLLGSCVAIVLTDPRRTVGAMCHVVHAGAPTGGCNTAYGDGALAEMARQLRSRGIDARQCQAWVYGGGNMFPGQVGDTAAQGNVGAANMTWALEALQRAGVHVLGASVGGHAYRKLRWTVGPEAPEVEAVHMALPPGPKASTP